MKGRLIFPSLPNTSLMHHFKPTSMPQAAMTYHHSTRDDIVLRPDPFAPAAGARTRGEVPLMEWNWVGEGWGSSLCFGGSACAAGKVVLELQQAPGPPAGPQADSLRGGREFARAFGLLTKLC